MNVSARFEALLRSSLPASSARRDVLGQSDVLETALQDAVVPAPEQGYSTQLWENGVHAPALHLLWQRMVLSRPASSAARQSPAFVRYLEEAEPESRFEVLTVHDQQDAIVGIVPVRLARLQLLFTFGAHQWSHARLRSLHVVGGEPLIDDRPEAIDSFFLSLPARYPDVDVFYMNEVRRDSTLWRHLANSSGVRRVFNIHVLDGFRECHAILVPKTLDEYRAKFTKKRRYNLARQQRILQQVRGSLDLQVVEDAAGLDDLLRALNRLVPPHQSAVLNRRQYEISAKHGFLRCFILKAGAEPIAVALGTKTGTHYRVHRCYYDRSLKKYSPGTTLWQLVLKHIITAREVETIDMGYGTPAYRHRGTNSVAHKGRILLFRRSFANQCHILVHTGYVVLSDFVKRQILREP